MRRDPRGWPATFAYFALIAADGLIIRQGANAADVAWWEIEGTRVRTELAFDHADILACAVARLRNKVEYASLPVPLLPEKFTSPDLQRVYEQILVRRMDKSAFRKRIAEADFLEPIPGEKRARRATGRRRCTGSSQAARSSSSTAPSDMAGRRYKPAWRVRTKADSPV